MTVLPAAEPIAKKKFTTVLKMIMKGVGYKASCLPRINLMFSSDKCPGSPGVSSNPGLRLPQARN